jgi:uncharacterized protein YndB with AHSA1/START domain
MNPAELSRSGRTIEIEATPERVGRALTGAAELPAWFQVTIEGEVAAGKEVWMTSLSEGCRGQRFRVLFLELTPTRRFVWQWHPGAAEENVDYSKEPRTTVTFTLAPSGSGTRLTVAETGFDAVSPGRRAKVYGENTQGWTEVLVWLKGYAEASS